ncbi:MAG: FAD-dependent oxidoreductase [Methylocystis sp.]
MTKVIVLGAGIGGVPLAFELKDMLGKKAEITVISQTDYFQFVPSNPWVAVKWRKPTDIKVSLPEVFKRRKIGFTSVGAKRVKPNENIVELNDGTSLPYDYLVIATGPHLAFDEIEGLGPKANTKSVCHVEHAGLAGEEWEAFCKNPGPMVIGAVQGASCFGPAYEYALTVVSDLRKRKIRDQVPITFVTSEPYIGHLGLGGVGDTKGMLESVMRDRDIKWVTNAKIDRVNADSVEATELNEDGSIKKTHKIATKFTMLLPAFRGVDCLKDEDGKWIEGLTNPRGFISVDRKQRNAKYPNIFAVGVCVALPPFEPTPVPVGMPKTGYMIESMCTAAAHNIRDLVAGKEPTHEGTWNAVCLADFGDNGIAFIAQPQIPPRNINWSAKGYWVHLAKVAYEIYFLRKVRKGQAEPIYERVIMKWLGIVRLKGKHA